MYKVMMNQIKIYRSKTLRYERTIFFSRGIRIRKTLLNANVTCTCDFTMGNHTCFGKLVIGVGIILLRQSKLKTVFIRISGKSPILILMPSLDKGKSIWMGS